MNKQYMTYKDHQDYFMLISEGAWNLQNVHQIEEKLRQTPVY